MTRREAQKRNWEIMQLRGMAKRMRCMSFPPECLNAVDDKLKALGARTEAEHRAQIDKEYGL